MSSNATGPNGAPPVSNQGVQASRALVTTLSLLLVAAGVQFTALAPSAVGWLIVAILLLLASASAGLVVAKLRKRDPAVSNDVSKDRDTIPGIISYYVTRSVRITSAVALLLLAGSGAAACWSYHVWRPPAPSAAFVRAHSGTLSSSSGQYLISLHNVQNVSSELVWLELAVPQYTARYAQTYLYYYTQASAQFGSPTSYDAIVDIANDGDMPTTEVITAFACSSDNAHIEAGASHPEIRKQAGCYDLGYICVRLPACQQARNCSTGRDVFAFPPECKKKSPVWIKQVAPLPR
jgi:hypothetical protein